MEFLASILAATLMALMTHGGALSVVGWAIFFESLQLPLIAAVRRGRPDPCTAWLRRVLAEKHDGASQETGPETRVRCGACAVIWAVGQVGGIVAARLRSWYAVPNEHHHRCALAAMLASGSDEFRDRVCDI